ncbi:hypothetical protein EXIGLDRAFT_752805 [Exidia glandulosa HHB12029]|uniref:Uncharacterized protein n=1 Tax=Exidia glandulosa HHB12029 TaxID=1314781 RepID=A0A165EAP1_EXIGL|nr:hypothetical protein EXIGLDRAFT_752805 [Exidia glandulosa HHB12029]
MDTRARDIRARLAALSPSSSGSTTPTVRDSDHSEPEDESLVLDDLVRIGEASRLRRRGALRLDLSTASTSTSTAGPDEQLAGLVAAVNQATTDDAFTYRVYCGTRIWSSGVASTSTSAPAPCPLPEPLPMDDYTCLPTQDDDERWTGCRALVHESAAPSTRDGTWLARGPPQPGVVRLDAAYFERGGRRVRRPCGCTGDGVGCRVCGNALGSIWRPCARHMALFPHGTGSVYSFFANATDSEPPFTFPPPVVPPPPLNSPHEPLPTSPMLLELELESPKS